MLGNSDKNINSSKYTQLFRIKTSPYVSWVVHTYPYKYPRHIIEFNSINNIKVCEVLVNTCILLVGLSYTQLTMYTDHFINGTKRLYVFLSIIFTLFLSHGFTPDSLILGTMIPIPKDKKKSFCSSSNYRAIALSSILNTILDWIILLKEHKSLSSSPLQFGFKKGLSTTQCTHSLLEIVDYYNYNKSDVFVLMLDASKAFDRVRYCKLFNELLERNISPVVLRILIYMYMNQTLRVSGARH